MRWKTVKRIGKTLKRTKQSVVNFLEVHALELEQHSREGKQFCFYKHLKSLDFEDTRRCSSQFIRDETGKLLRDPQEILQR